MVNKSYFLILILINIFILFNHKTLINIIRLKFDILDHPNVKLKHHIKSTPLFGGIWIYINLLVFFVYFFIFRDNLKIYSPFNNYIDATVVLFFFTAIFCVGFFDDVYNLDPNKKLFSFFFIVVCFLLLVPDLLIQNLQFTYKDLNLNLGLRKFSFLFTALCIVALINAINMLDGIDGQVALYSFFFVTIFQIFIYQDLSFFLVTLGITLSFFFILNIRGKIFFGNSGSYLLGFIFSFLFLSEYKNDNISINFIFMLVILPALELLRVCFNRLINGRNPFKGDRDHLHHLLLKRFTKFQSIIIFQIIFIIPFILYYFGFNKINTLIFSLITYFILVVFLKKA